MTKGNTLVFFLAAGLIGLFVVFFGGLILMVGWNIFAPFALSGAKAITYTQALGAMLIVQALSLIRLPHVRE